MKLIKVVLGFLRLPNILIIGLTAYMIRYCLFSTVFNPLDIPFYLNNLEFLFLVVSIMLATAGGYLINDIYDLLIDKINKKNKVYIGKYITIKFALFLYILINIAGHILYIYVVWRADYLLLLFIYPITVFLIWWYTYYLQRTPLWGNLIVSLFCSMVVIMIWLFEKDSYNLLVEKNIVESTKLLLVFVFYCLFAFFSTLCREIIKDMEDIKGDLANNVKTLAVLYGLRTAKTVVLLVELILLLLIISFLILSYKYLSIMGILYGIILLIVPVIMSGYLLIKANSKKHFNRIQKITKIIMLLGLLFLAVISYF